MASRVTVYQIPAHKRSMLIGAAMAQGIHRVGDDVRVMPSTSYRVPDSDIAVFYGFDETMRDIFRGYRAAGRPVVYVDLGYWGRKDLGRWTGFHKVSVNNRHPTAYFQKRPHNGSRAAQFGIKFKEWSTGSHILVAGTSDKGAIVDGFAPEEWERWAITELRRHTDRPIIYRAKPSWLGARPIPGSCFQQTRDDVGIMLEDCHAVVTHHSNVSIDGLIAGVPAFCLEGLATPLALSDLSRIEEPRREGDREQLVNDISWCQFNVQEMTDGVAWRHLKEEGLLL